MNQTSEKLNLRPVAYASWKEARAKIQELRRLDRSSSLLCLSVQIDDLHQSNQKIHMLIKALHKLNSNKDMKTKIILVALNLYSQHLRIFGSVKILQK